MKKTAVDAYMVRVGQINEQIAKLKARADNMFDNSPDAVTWGSVGDLGRVIEALDRALDVHGGEP